MTIMLHTPPPDPAALARRPDTAGPLAVATPTTRKLADASLSVNTRRAYLGALARVDAWRGAAPVDDARLAAYLAHVFESGRAPATAERPRTDGRGVESHTTAQRRGRMDAVIAGLLFMAGMRRSEVSAVEWRDVTDATDGAGVLVAVRQSKTNPDGDTADLRYLKNGAARAVRTLRASLGPGALRRYDFPRGPETSHRAARAWEFADRRRRSGLLARDRARRGPRLFRR